MSDRTRTGDRGPANPAVLLLCLVCSGSAATIVVLGSHLTFFHDDWYVLLLRPGVNADALLEPHNGHLSVLLILAYKGLAAAFGLDAQLPFRLLLAALTVATGVAVFLHARRCVGDALALLAATVILFLGSGAADLLATFQIGLVGSLATGLFALLALERTGRGAQLTACALLVASICLSNLGVSFVIAAAATIVLRRRPASGWIVAIPAAIFAVWWVIWGQGDELTGTTTSTFSWGNVARSPIYLLDSVSAGLASITGLGNTSNGYDAFAWGRPLLALALLALAALLGRGWRPPLAVLPITCAAFSFWILLAFNFVEWRGPDAGRYQLISATFLILLAAEMARGVRLRAVTVLIIAGVGLVGVGSNLSAYATTYDYFREAAETTKAVLAALDIGRDHIDPGMSTGAAAQYTSGVVAGDYYRERDQHGSPAYSPAELEAATPSARMAADVVLASGYALALEPASKGLIAGPNCGTLKPQFDASPAEMALPPGGVGLLNGSVPVHIGLRRFGDEPSTDLGTLAAGHAALVPIPTDAVDRPWRLAVSGGSSLRVCGLGSLPGNEELP